MAEGGAGAGGRVRITFTLPGTLYSQSSGSVTDPIWAASPVGTPGAAIWGSGTTMVVQSGHTVTANDNVDVNDLIIEGGAELALASGTFTVFGDVVAVTGTLSGTEDGELSLLGADPTALGGSGSIDLHNIVVNTPGGTTVTGSVVIRNTLLLEDGDLDATGAEVVLFSDATGTGRMGPVSSGASYTGSITMQRYIPGGATNWRLLGSAVGGRTVADWNDDFFTAGFPGSNYPPFYVDGELWPSIRWYDEANDSIVGVSGTGQSLAVGQGFAVWSGDALGGTQPFIVDVTGPPTIANAPVTLPMTYAGAGANAGFNLVSNPLPSAIDFANVSLGGDVANFYYIYDPATGNNAAWNGTVGTNGATGIIQSSQGFWLKADGPDVTTTVGENAKSNNTFSGGLFGGQEEAPPMVRLKVSGPVNSFSDETLVVFAAGTPGSDDQDVAKFVFAHPLAPQIASRSADGQDLAISMFGPYQEAITIPVLVNVAESGVYTITASDMTGLDGLSCLRLEDLVSGTVVPLVEGATMDFSIAADDDPAQPRFLLHASAPVPVAVTDALCASEQGQVAVTTVEATSSLIILDANGVPVAEGADLPAGMVFMASLPGGTYELQVSSSAGCGTLLGTFDIAVPEELVTEVVTDAPSCPGESDGRLEASVVGGTAPYTFLWSNGESDAAIAVGAGTYEVIVTDAAGCITEVADLVVVDPQGPLAGFATPGDVVQVDEPVQFTSTSTPGAWHFWEFGDGNTSEEVDPLHAYALPGNYVVVLTVMDGPCSASAVGEVTVEASTGIAEGTGSEVAVWSDGASLIVEHGLTTGTVHVEVLDATGRLHAQQQAAAPGRIIVPAGPLTTGIWFVRVSHEGMQRTVRVPVVR